MSPRNLTGGKERLALKADDLTAIYEPIFYKISHNPLDIASLLQG
jgi:hypothetical protein